MYMLGLTSPKHIHLSTVYYGGYLYKIENMIKNVTATYSDVFNQNV